MTTSAKSWYRKDRRWYPLTHCRNHAWHLSNSSVRPFFFRRAQCEWTHKRRSLRRFHTMQRVERITLYALQGCLFMDNMNTHVSLESEDSKLGSRARCFRNTASTAAPISVFRGRVENVDEERCPMIHPTWLIQRRHIYCQMREPKRSADWELFRFICYNLVCRCNW